MSAAGNPRGPKSPADDAALTEGLRHLGLTDYEIRVYLAILKHPASRIPEVARSSGVPQPKVYPTVKRLLERGLLESELGPVNTYNALAPELSFAPLLADLERRASDATDAIQGLQEEFEEPGDSIGAREGRIKLFQGKQAIRRNFLELVARSEASIAIVARLPLMVSDDDEQMQEAIARGVAVRILIEAPKDYDFASEPLFAKNDALGVEQRHLAAVPLRMGIFDGRVSILPMQDSAKKTKGFMMLEVRNEGLSEGLTGMFDLLWKTAKPLVL